MEIRFKDPYCHYLFQNEDAKSLLIAQHELDIASFYGKRTGIKTEKYYTGEALLEILKTVFTHKKFLKYIKKDEENEVFYSNNCKMLEDEIGSNNFNGEHLFPIVMNYLTIVNHNLCQSNSNGDKKLDDDHLHSPEIVQKIRNIYGLKLRSLEQMNLYYLFSKVLISIILLFLIFLICVVSACILDWYQVIDFSQKFTIFAPFVTRSETNILKITALLGAVDLYQSSIMIIIGEILLVMLLFFSVISIVRIHKTEKLDYRVHYLSRIIGESSQKLREIGWL